MSKEACTHDKRRNYVCERERELCSCISTYTPVHTNRKREYMSKEACTHDKRRNKRGLPHVCVVRCATYVKRELLTRAKRPADMSKETCIYAQRVMCTYVNRCLYLCHKKPISRRVMYEWVMAHMSTDAYIYVTRSLYLGVSYMNESWHICLKRPISNDYEVSMILYVTRSLYLGVSCMNESWRICQKRPISLPQEAHIFGNRPMDMSEEAYVYEKRHVKDTCRCNTATHCDTLQHTATHCMKRDM